MQSLFNYQRGFDKCEINPDDLLKYLAEKDMIDLPYGQEQIEMKREEVF